MAKKWTVTDLAGLSVKDRHDLYKNACRLAHTEAGAVLKELIEQAGLPFSDDACLKSDDPIVLKMYEVINSPDGRKACLDATMNGLPAMAGADPMLQAALGVDYGKHAMGTVTAGSIVGEMMRSLGYRNGGKRKLPGHCLARTAEFWV